MNDMTPEKLRSGQQSNAEYEEFVDKFRPKLTTDDCYTPPLVYDAVLDWVRAEYRIPGSTRILRPFYPGGDYKAADYSGDCLVVDNPPFSILTEIERYYIDHGVRFFLFAPSLTIFKPYDGMAFLCAYAKVTYDNGAEVATSFVTNLEPPTVLARSVPDLVAVVQRANDETQKALHKSFPKYAYPDEVLTAAMLNYMSVHGTPFTVYRRDAHFIRTLDSQRPMKKSVYGGGFLLSEKAAAEKAAAEKAAAEKAAAEKTTAIRWAISERERDIVSRLG